MKRRQLSRRGVEGAPQCLGRRRLPGTPIMGRSANVLKLEDLPGFELRLDSLWL